MTLPTTGFTSESPNNFLLDAGAIFKDVVYNESTGEFEGTPLGATSGGVAVSIVHNYRKIDVDGTYIMDVMGLNRLENATCTIKASMKELSAETLRLGMNGVIEDADPTEAPAGTKVIKLQRFLDEGDYIQNMAVVGNLSNGKQIIFLIDNGLVKSSMELETKDNEETVYELEIVANASYDQLAANEFPWRIFYPETPDTELEI
jgi:hypothetical protein